MDYEIVIGLEIHSELNTKTKIFCSCANKFGAKENTQTCPVCLGFPGVLPVLNEKVIDYAVTAGLALNCDIAKYSKLDRKNYFYPDLPKAYQISQYDLPLCSNGKIEIEIGNKKKEIGITRIHIEEDAGKLIHDSTDGTLADYNRCGVPLIEIVTEPDIRSAEEARIFAEKVKSILEYTEVSDCKMQEGSLRFDVNLSVREKGSNEFGTRTEMKNLNSFRSLVRAIDYESKRQIDQINKGNKIVQETRKWDDNKGMSFSLRSKEEAHDYRYFPDPDLVPIILTDSFIETKKDELPELPNSRKERYIKELGLPPYDAEVLTFSKDMANYFENVTNIIQDAKITSNWLMGEVSALLKEKELEIKDIPFNAEKFAQLLRLIKKNTISGSIGKKVLKEMFQTSKNPEDIINEKGWVQMNDSQELKNIVEKIIKENPQSIEDIKAGKEKAFGFLVGQCMRITKGKANPQVVNTLLRESIAKHI